MATRRGKTLILSSAPNIRSFAAAVGKKEGEGPLGKEFDEVYDDTTMGESSWEKAESLYLKAAIRKAMEKGEVKGEEVDILCSGDLLNQCIASGFAMRDLGLPFCGLYGACSTMALSLCVASMMIETGGFRQCIAATSSHFCSAEKQFRKPLEYGGQRSPTAQWTVTGAAAVVLTPKEKTGLYIDKIHFGTVRDYGITDSSNMGAAMAPAAANTIKDFLQDTGTVPQDYDAIFTGDLGSVGSKLLRQLLLKEAAIDIAEVHKDCGVMIYDLKRQDAHAGGSGCGCSGSVLCGHILPSMLSGKYKNILFVATGALMSAVSSLQGESVPGIAHLVNIKRR